MTVPAVAADAMVPVPHRVLDRVAETGDTVTLELARVDGSALAFVPGQFNMLAPFGIGEAAISIAGSASDPDRVVHTVRSVGAVTAAITALQPGDVVGVRGPFGAGWPVDRAQGRDVVVVAGGIGLAPLRPLVLEVLGNRSSYEGFWLVYGARSPGDLLYKDDLHDWRARFDTHVEVTVDRADERWRGDVGVVTRFLGQVMAEANRPIVMVCGPEVMMQLVAERFVDGGIDPGDIYLSMERNMKCGIGHCGHCQFGPDFVCLDGPVFRFGDVQRRMRVREL